MSSEIWLEGSGIARAVEVIASFTSNGMLVALFFNTFTLTLKNMFNCPKGNLLVFENASNWTSSILQAGIGLRSGQMAIFSRIFCIRDFAIFESGLFVFWSALKICVIVTPKESLIAFPKLRLGVKRSSPGKDISSSEKMKIVV